jgi:hypothetical protein
MVTEKEYIIDFCIERGLYNAAGRLQLVEKETYNPERADELRFVHQCVFPGFLNAVTYRQNGIDTVMQCIRKWPGLVRAACPNRKTALMYACEVAGGLEVVDVLIEAGADVNATSASGKTALWYAIIYGDIYARHSYHQVVERLLGYGADPDAVDDLGLTPLMVEARRYCMCAPQSLLALVAKNISTLLEGGAGNLEAALQYAEGGNRRVLRPCSPLRCALQMPVVDDVGEMGKKPRCWWQLWRFVGL